MAGFQPAWPCPANVGSYISTRQGGVSAGPYKSNNMGLHVGDDAKKVIQNRQLLLTSCEVPRSAWLQQVHGDVVIDAIDAPTASVSDSQQAPIADGVTCQKPGVACVIMTADCLPILLCDQAGTQVAAIHCGWRGLVNALIPKTVAAFNAKPSDLMVYLGPAISKQHYEVGSDVLSEIEQLRSEDSSLFMDSMITTTRPGHALLDLYALASWRLKSLGVTHIYGGDTCTLEQKELFYSFRRDGQTGRMASLIWLKD